MKKSTFVTMMLGTLGGLLFALGMCMALLPEWNMFKVGILVGLVGIIVLLLTLAIWRKMTKKTPIKISKKMAGGIGIGIVGTLFLGTGMSLVMIFNQMILGIIIGMAGILVLLSLIPYFKGFRD